MRMAGDFSSAWQLLRWASEDIENLDSASEAFLGNNPYTFFFEDDAESGDVFLKLRVASVPDKICKLASHALWDIKHALDHATCAAVVAVGGVQDSDIHFPVRSHPNDFESALRATAKNSSELKYPASLHDTFRRFEPYPTGSGYTGGGDEFCVLSKLANTTKHLVALSTIPQPDIAAFRGTGGIDKIFMRWGGKQMRDRIGQWDAAKNELTIGLVKRDAELDMDMQIASFISFGEIEILKDYPASRVLGGYAIAVRDIVGELERVVA